jgi:hydroxyacid-oxoacid transhydrogenase
MVARATETIFGWQAPAIRFGVAATSEVGYELVSMGVRRSLIVTDVAVAGTGLPAAICGTLAELGIAAEVWTGSQTEPTDTSIARAIEDLRDIDVDGYVALGGGSVIDTCKLINLLKTHGGELIDFVSAPHGEGRDFPGRLAPMIGVTTTAGTGSECTAIAMVDLSATHTKAAVAHPWMRPTLAIVDPENSLTCPPPVTASAGYDALIQALESYTSKPYDHRPPARSPAHRPAYVGFNPISKLWSEEAIVQAGRFLLRAFMNGHDLEARTGMALAALFSRLGNSGVHVPHANAYALAGMVREYRAAGYNADRPFVPHGQAVVATAANAFEFTFAAAPERHLRAAELLGVSREERLDDPQNALPNWIRCVVEKTGGPRTLETFGYTRDDIPQLVARSVDQQRVLVCSPRPVGADELRLIFEQSFSAPAFPDHAAVTEPHADSRRRAAT